jgi:Protein of unknown function (DUF2442)
MSELRIHQLSFTGDSMRVAFSDERNIVVALGDFPRLRKARLAELEQWRLIGRGLGVHWPLLDEDLSVENILAAYSRAKAGTYAQVAP